MLCSISIGKESGNKLLPSNKASRKKLKGYTLRQQMAHVQMVYIAFFINR